MTPGQGHRHAAQGLEVRPAPPPGAFPRAHRSVLLLRSDPHADTSPPELAQALAARAPQPTCLPQLTVPKAAEEEAPTGLRVGVLPQRRPQRRGVGLTAGKHLVSQAGKHCWLFFPLQAAGTMPASPTPIALPCPPTPPDRCDGDKTASRAERGPSAHEGSLYLLRKWSLCGGTLCRCRA